MELLDHQLERSDAAVELLKRYRIAYLCMEVRTGKSLTAFRAIEKYGAKRVLILTSKGAISSIKKDYEVLPRAFSVEFIWYLDKKDWSEYAGRFDLLVVDEAHRIGQFAWPADSTKALKKIVGAKPVIYLSGTPSPENYSQLYHQFWISENSPFREFPTFYAWANTFVIKKTKKYYGREIVDYSGAKPDMVESYTKHLFLTCTQAEAGFTQFVEEHIIPVVMSESTYYLANKIIKDKVFEGKNGRLIIADTGAKMQQKLHQIYSGTIIPDPTIEDPNPAAILFDDAKIKAIEKNFRGKKIAIFYKFKGELALLKRAFGAKLTADPDEFNESEDKIFARQYISGREGINVSTADALVMLNIDFSSVSYQQSKARLQHLNRTKPCLVYWLFAVGGIEEKIYEVLMKKKNYTLSYFRKDYKLDKKF